MELKKSDLLEMYRLMVLTRSFDIKTNEWYLQGLLKEEVHQSTGQEAISIGSCYGLFKTDQVLPSHRTRGVFFARGVNLKTHLREMAAKLTSSTKGHHSSRHAYYPEAGILPGTGVLGSTFSIGVGAALAIQIEEKDDIVIIYFGDGTINRGDFHECLNLAAVWNLPCIFILENNQISVWTEQKFTSKNRKFSDRAIGYGIPGYTIDGNNVLEVYEYTQEAIKRARNGKGPTLLDCVTFRVTPHVSGDNDTRPKKLIEEWIKKCPIKKLEKYLVENNMVKEEELKKIKVNVDREIEEAFKAIINEPNVTMEDMFTNVYEEKKEVR